MLNGLVLLPFLIIGMVFLGLACTNPPVPGADPHEVVERRLTRPSFWDNCEWQLTVPFCAGANEAPACECTRERGELHPTCKYRCIARKP
jgi:hypothetical protein